MIPTFIITFNGTNVTNYVVKYNRTQELCTGTATCSITFEDTFYTNYSPVPYDIIIVYESGNKKGTFYVESVDVSPTAGVVIVDCTDESKKMHDYFIDESYMIDYVSYCKYWIEKFLTDAGVSYNFTESDEGSILSNNTTLGKMNCFEAVTTLVQYCGWYFMADPDGVMQIGKIDIDVETHDIVLPDENDILTVKILQDDNILRNRVVVWGAGNEDTGEESSFFDGGTEKSITNWVFAEASVYTPYNYDQTDLRTAVLSNGNIYSAWEAKVLAERILKETNHIKHTKEVSIAGFVDTYVGETAFLDTSVYQGWGLITNIDVIGSSSGIITTIRLDERCPRLYAHFDTISPFIEGKYVYIGTQGDGVWRKPFSADGWTDYSAGLADLNVTDLAINRSRMACVTSDGQLYVRETTAGAWRPVSPTTFIATLSGNLTGQTMPSGLTEEDVTVSGLRYSASDVVCMACDINQWTNDVLAVYTLKNQMAFISGMLMAVYSGQPYSVALPVDGVIPEEDFIAYSGNYCHSWVTTFQSSTNYNTEEIILNGSDDVFAYDVCTDGLSNYVVALAKIPTDPPERHTLYDSWYNDWNSLALPVNPVTSGLLQVVDYDVVYYDDWLEETELYEKFPERLINPEYASKQYWVHIEITHKAYEESGTPSDYYGEFTLYILSPQPDEEHTNYTDGSYYTIHYEETITNEVPKELFPYVITFNSLSKDSQHGTGQESEDRLTPCVWWARDKFGSCALHVSFSHFIGGVFTIPYTQFRKKNIYYIWSFLGQDGEFTKEYEHTAIFDERYKVSAAPPFPIYDYEEIEDTKTGDSAFDDRLIGMPVGNYLVNYTSLPGDPREYSFINKYTLLFENTVQLTGSTYLTENTVIVGMSHDLDAEDNCAYAVLMNSVGGGKSRIVGFDLRTGEVRRVYEYTNNYYGDISLSDSYLVYNGVYKLDPLDVRYIIPVRIVTTTTDRTSYYEPRRQGIVHGVARRMDLGDYLLVDGTPIRTWIESSLDNPLVAFGGNEYTGYGFLKIFPYGYRDNTINIFTYLEQPDPNAEDGTYLTPPIDMEITDVFEGEIYNPSFIPDVRVFNWLDGETKTNHRYIGFTKTVPSGTPIMEGETEVGVEITISGMGDIYLIDYLDNVTNDLSFPQLVEYDTLPVASGVCLTKLETTNTQDIPFVFACTSGVSPRFFEKMAMLNNALGTQFVEYVLNIPSSIINCIRTDDKL